MSQFSRDPRGARDFSSPQVRVRGANDFRTYSDQRLRLPNERPPLGPLLRRLIGALLTLAAVGGIGVGVYFGVTELLAEDESGVASTQEASEADQSVAASSAESQTETDSASEQSAAAEPQAASAEPEVSDAAQETPTQDDEPAATSTDAAADSATAQQEQSEADAPSISAVVPTVSEDPVVPAQIGGAEIVAERVTAEAIPSGIPRTLADGVEYDPTEPATVFTSRWPIGTTLRLTRLPGATLLTDEQQAQILGAQALVVVRDTEATNTDLQMSPAAFDLIAFYGIERIIAVRVEVVAPPP